MASSDPPSSTEPRPSSSPSSSSLGALSDALTTAVQNLMEGAFLTGKRQRASTDDAEDNDEGKKSSAASYLSYGRTYSRQGELFTPTADIVEHGIKISTADSDNEIVYSAEEQQKTATWKLLCRVIPQFQEHMLSLSGQKPLRKAICKQIDKGIHLVRAEDMNSIKKSIAVYLLKDSSLPLNPPLTVGGKKSSRGLHHEVTAALICPLKYPATAETYADILEGRKPMTAHLLPRFLYPDGQEYNPADIEDGVLKGHLMLRIAKHILQGPSAALEKPGYHRGKQGNASLMGLTSVTPRVIGYIAVQTRFALSSQEQWALVDGDFHYRDFFWLIVSMFNDGEGLDIIQLYNHHVFGDKQGSEKENHVEEAGPSDFELLKAQREARKRARKSTD